MSWALRVLRWGAWLFLLNSCGREDPPASSRPLSPSRLRGLFEGTWVTDQGALVISDTGPSLFLPNGYPCAYFEARVVQGWLEFESGHDREVRWKASLRLTQDRQEISEDLVRTSRKNIEAAGVGALASVVAKDLFTADLSSATVVALYLPESFLERLKPQLEKLPRGARIVSHQFRMAGFAPDKVVRMESSDDGQEHTLYLWTTPLK